MWDASPRRGPRRSRRSSRGRAPASWAPFGEERVPGPRPSASSPGLPPSPRYDLNITPRASRPTTISSVVGVVAERQRRDASGRFLRAFSARCLPSSPARHAPRKTLVVRVPVVVRVVAEPQGRRRVLEAQLFVVRPLRLQLAVVLLAVDGRRGRRVGLLVARASAPTSASDLPYLNCIFCPSTRARCLKRGRVGLARDALAGPRSRGPRNVWRPLSWPPWGNFWMGGRAWRGRGGSRGGGSRARRRRGRRVWRRARHRRRARLPLVRRQRRGRQARCAPARFDWLPSRRFDDGPPPRRLETRLVAPPCRLEPGASGCRRAAGAAARAAARPRARATSTPAAV